MNILFAGCTAAQRSGFMPRTKTWTFSGCLSYMLPNIGRVVSGDLDDALAEAEIKNPSDTALIGWTDPTSLSARRIIQVLVIVGNRVRRGLPVALYLDDWRFKEAEQRSRIYKNTLSKRLAFSIVQNRSSQLFVDKYMEDIELGLDAISSKSLPMLIPAHTWGYHSEFAVWGDRVTVVDPSAHYMIMTNKKGSEIQLNRARRWVVACLMDWAPMYDYTWPVIEFTGNTFEDDPKTNKKKRHPRVLEAVVEVAYSENFGLIIPKYAATKSGWWRARYVQAVKYNNVISGDLHPEMQDPAFAVSVADIESMTDTELADVIVKQNLALARSWETTSDVERKVAKLLQVQS